MPIKPENKALYPKDWKAISLAARDRAGNCCEGSPAYPECRVANGEPHPATQSRVILTVAHLDHDPANCAPANLKAWCNRCHLTYDAQHHAKNAAITRRQRKLDAGAQELLAVPDEHEAYSSRGGKAHASD